MLPNSALPSVRFLSNYRKLRGIEDNFCPQCYTQPTPVLETSARLLRLLSLLQARRFWTGPELAERLETSERTVRRDIERLRSLGYPVDATSGVAGGYQLGAGATLPPLLLEDDEALAVSIALRTAANGSLPGNAEAALRALAKLERVLPVRLRRRVNALSASILPFGSRGPYVKLEVLATLAAACNDRETLRFCYQDSAARPTTRWVEPHGLAHTGYRWYLAAWDLERNAWRIFRVDRISGNITPSIRFTPRPPPGDSDLATYVRHSLAVSVYSARARILLHAPLEEISTRISPAAGVLQSVDASRTLLETGAHSLHILAVWIGQLGVDFEILEPPELIDHLAALAQHLHDAVARSRTANQRKPAGPSAS